jgi:hypothetical protein
MKRKRSLLVAVLTVAAMSALAFVSQFHSRGKAAQPATTTGQAERVIPDHVPYMFLFKHHHFNLQKADELAQQGKDDSQYRLMFKRRAGLSDREAQDFDQITRECNQELAQQDAKAQAVIAEFRKQYPDGKLPEGVTLPPPPPELTQLQQEHDAIILRARDRLHAALGDEEFTRFDSFVQSRVKGGIKTSGKNQAQVP